MWHLLAPAAVCVYLGDMKLLPAALGAGLVVALLVVLYPLAQAVARQQPSPPPAAAAAATTVRFEVVGAYTSAVRVIYTPTGPIPMPAIGENIVVDDVVGAVMAVASARDHTVTCRIVVNGEVRDEEYASNGGQAVCVYLRDVPTVEESH